MKYLILIAIVLVGLASAKEYDRPCRNSEVSPNVHTNFNVERYLGLWYEIRRYEAQNQTDFDCVLARYSANADGSVQVVNSGYVLGGPRIEFIGRASLTSPDATPLVAKLDVTFAPNPWTSIYWVLDTDYDNIAVVWSCRELPNDRSNESLWVLSRRPEVNAESQNRYQEVLRRNNLVLDATRETSRDFIRCSTGGK